MNGQADRADRMSKASVTALTIVAVALGLVAFGAYGAHISLTSAEEAMTRCVRASAVESVESAYGMTLSDQNVDDLEFPTRVPQQGPIVFGTTNVFHERRVVEVTLVFSGERYVLVGEDGRALLRLAENDRTHRACEWGRPPFEKGVE